MARKFLVSIMLVVIIAVAIGFSTGGCALFQPTGGSGGATTQPSGLTPLQVWTAANQTLTAIDTGLLAFRPLFGQNDWARVQAATKTASDALDAWGQHLNDPASQQASAVFSATIADLAQMLVDMQQKHPAATQPSAGSQDIRVQPRSAANAPDLDHRYRTSPVSTAGSASGDRRRTVNSVLAG